MPNWSGDAKIGKVSLNATSFRRYHEMCGRVMFCNTYYYESS